MSTELDDKKLARRLLIIDVVLKQTERLLVTAGAAALTPVRIAEMVAEESLRDIEGFDLEQFHICPGYSNTHVWTKTNYVWAKAINLRETENDPGEPEVAATSALYEAVLLLHSRELAEQALDTGTVSQPKTGYDDPERQFEVPPRPGTDPIPRRPKKLSRREKFIAARKASDPSAADRDDVDYSSDELPSVR